MRVPTISAPGVEVQGLAAPTQTAQGADPAAFGGVQAAQLGKIADIAGGVQDDAFSIMKQQQQIANDSAVYKANTALQTSINTFTTNAKTQRLGDNAQGLTTDAATFYNSQKQALMDALPNDYTKRIFNQMADRSAVGLSEFALGHENSQLLAGQVSNIAAHSAAVIQGALVSPTPEALANARGELTQGAAQVSSLSGKNSPDQVTQAALEQTTALYVPAITQAIDQKQPGVAAQIYADNKQYINPLKHDEIEKQLLGAQQENIVNATVTDALTPGSDGKQTPVAQLRQDIYDGTMKLANGATPDGHMQNLLIQELNARHGMQTQEQEQGWVAASDAAWKIAVNGGGTPVMPKPSDLAAMDGRQAGMLVNWVKEKQAGKERTVADPGAVAFMYAKMQDGSIGDLTEGQYRNVWSQLTPGYQNVLAQAWTGIKQPKPDKSNVLPEGTGALITKSVKGLGINLSATPKTTADQEKFAQGNAVVEYMQTSILQAQTALGRQMTQDELQKEVHRVELITKPMDITDWKGSTTRTNVPVISQSWGDLSASRQQAIDAQLTRQGLPINPTTRHRAYLGLLPSN